jgi:membrane protease YdiL (CAAX protease family)
MRPRVPQLIVFLVVLLGGCYVAAAYWSPAILRAFGEQQRGTLAEWQARGSTRLAVIYLPHIVIVAIILSLLRLPQGSELRESLKRLTRHDVMAFGLTTAFVSFVLALLQLWPWTWQWPPHSALRLASALTKGRQWLGLLVWALATVVLIPLIEEVVFRFGVLRFFESVSGSSTVGVVASAVTFATAHLGGSIHPNRAHLTNAAWLFAASILLGIVTVRHRGSLGPAITAHAARNLVEFAMLFTAFH